MSSRKTTSRSIFYVFGLLILAGFLTGCTATAVSLAQATVPPPAQTSTPEPAQTRPGIPPTWTPTIANARVLASTSTPYATPNFKQTMVAQTTIAAGIHCKRHPDAWQVFSHPINSYAGWCQVVGRGDTFYEYKLLVPDGWVVNTFGEITPNLAFSTGEKDVVVNLYQAYSYFTRSYEGSLEDAPETASVCDENDKCMGFISPHETLVREEIKRFAYKDVLVLDSTAGMLDIRRYYQIIPFNVDDHKSDRLFILEFSVVRGALSEEQYQKTVAGLETLLISIMQR